jgi:hypothetical protein
MITPHRPIGKTAAKEAAWEQGLMVEGFLIPVSAASFARFIDVWKKKSVRLL